MPISLRTVLLGGPSGHWTHSIGWSVDSERLVGIVYRHHRHDDDDVARRRQLFAPTQFLVQRQDDRQKA